MCSKLIVFCAVVDQMRSDGVELGNIASCLQFCGGNIYLFVYKISLFIYETRT